MLKITAGSGITAMSLNTGGQAYNCGMRVIGGMSAYTYDKTFRGNKYKELLLALKSGNCLTCSEGWGRSSHGAYQLSDCKYGESNYGHDDKTYVPSIYEMMTKYGPEVLGDQLQQVGPIYNPNSSHPIYIWIVTTDIGKQLGDVQ